MGIGESHLAQFPTTPHLNGKVFLLLLQLLLQRKPTKSFGPISPICLPLWWSMAMIIKQTRRSVSEEEDGNEDSSGRNTFLLWALLCILFFSSDYKIPGTIDLLGGIVHQTYITSLFEITVGRGLSDIIPQLSFLPFDPFGLFLLLHLLSSYRIYNRGQKTRKFSIKLLSVPCLVLRTIIITSTRGPLKSKRKTNGPI